MPSLPPKNGHGPALVHQTSALPAATLMVLAEAAEWMADTTTHEDRDGRCNTYLMQAARDARKAAEETRNA